MKKNVLVIALFALTVLFSNETTAQKFGGLDKSPMDAVFYSVSRASEKIVKVVYGRPQLKGRSLATLAPAGKVWRTGANEATEITFYKDVTFGGEAVKAGTYTLFTIPAEKGDWTVILNTSQNVWGAFSYKEAEDVVRVNGTVSTSAESLEAFSMTFDEDMNLYMGWGKTVVKVTID